MLADPNIRDPNISGVGVGAELTTVVLQPPTEDAYNREYAPTVVHGNNAYASYNPHSADNHYCYYKFDFGSIPDDVVVTAAKLELYNYVLIAGAKQLLDLRAHRITEAWGEATLTWNNKPSYAATNMGNVSLLSVWKLGWVVIPLTDLTEFEQMLDDIYYGLMLKYSGEVGSHNYYRHYTHEYTTDPTLNPKLTVTYV